MARPIKVLWLGGSNMANVVSAGDLDVPAVDNVNGMRTKAQEWLAANDASRSYTHINEGSPGGDFVLYLPDSFNSVAWQNQVEPNLPVDLAVMDGGYSVVSANLAAFFNQLQQTGDDVGTSAILVAQALTAYGVNCVCMFSNGNPNAFRAPVDEVDDYTLTSNRVGDLVYSIPSVLTNAWPGPDLRTLLQPVESYFPLNINAEQGFALNAAGALLAGDTLGQIIANITRSCLQPDQDGS